MKCYLTHNSITSVYIKLLNPNKHLIKLINLITIQLHTYLRYQPQSDMSSEITNHIIAQLKKMTEEQRFADVLVKISEDSVVETVEIKLEEEHDVNEEEDDGSELMACIMY